MARIIFIIISICLSFAGCQHLEIMSSKPPAMSDVPIPSPYVESRQHIMQAAYHWEVLARNVASTISAEIARDFPEYQEPIYVAPAGITPFDKAFHDFLITSLVNRGLVVSHNHKNPLVLSFNTQVLSHNRVSEPNRRARVPKKEVMVTLSLMYRGAYLMRNSSIYYINAPEWWHYAQKSEVTSPSVAVYTLVDK